MNWPAIIEQIETSTGRPFKLVRAQAIAGGDINMAYRLSSEHETCFIKLNRPGQLSMFEAEACALVELARSQTVRVPCVIVAGKTAENAFLALEHIDFGSASKASERLLGRQLAQLHRQNQPYFGWHRDNTIGSTPQRNGQYADWPGFWREQRLGFQLTLAAENGYGGRLQATGQQLGGVLEQLFDNYSPEPSLLHGDLWAGNAAADTQGRPVIFDPACYYGDREADLAMTELFGGFSPDFYAAYNEVWPLDSGYPIRKALYNLYHILNHLNLFGGGYLRQAEHQLDRLLAEIR